MRRPCRSATTSKDIPGNQPHGRLLGAILPQAEPEETEYPISAERSPASDGRTLVVRLPVRFQRRGGRERIVASDGSRSQPDGIQIKAFARAWRRQKLLDTEVYISMTEICGADGIGKRYVSRILRVALVAPHVVGGPEWAVDAGTAPQTLPSRLADAHWWFGCSTTRSQ